MKMKLFLSFIPKLQVRMPCAASPAMAPAEVESSRVVEADAGCCLRSPSSLGRAEACAGGAAGASAGGSLLYAYCRVFYTALGIALM